MLKGRKITGIADPSIFGEGNGHGESTAQLMARNGVLLARGQLTRQWLAADALSVRV